MTPSMWIRYQRELRDVQALEKEYGFVYYTILPTKVLHIEDVWIHPDFRSSGKTRELLAELEEIGRTSGCTQFLGHIDVISKTCTDSLRMQLALGFVPFSAEAGRIWLKRDIAVKGE